MRILAVVLAAGEGRRMGGPKALLATGEADTFLARACAALDRPGVEGVIAVLGAEAARVASEAGLPPAVSLRVNERWRDGMLTSVWAGLDAAEAAGAEAVLVHPVDNPVVSAATVDRGGGRSRARARGSRCRRTAAAAATPRASRAPRSRPCAAADPARGARAVLAEHPDWVEHVPAGPDCLVDVDTPADLRASLRGFTEDEEPPQTQ